MGMPDMNNQKRKKLYQTKQGPPLWLPDYVNSKFIGKISFFTQPFNLIIGISILYEIDVRRTGLRFTK